MTVYIGAIEGDGLTVATADPMSGALTVVGELPDVVEPSFLVHGPGTVVYAVAEVSVGAVTTLDVGDPVRPTVRGVRETGGAGPTHLCVHGGFLVVAHYSDGTVSTHPLREDGSVGERATLLRHPGQAPHAHQVSADPTGRWVLAVDLGADAVFVHALDPRTGVLTQHSRFDLPAGTGPRHLAFAPDGATAWILGELTPTVTTVRWNPVNGTLTEIARTAIGADPGARAGAPAYPAEILAVRASGPIPAPRTPLTAVRVDDSDTAHVYATVRGEDRVVVFEAARGALTPLGSASAGGSWPRHCALDPTGRWLYVANQRSGTVAWLPRDPESGVLGPPTGTITVRGASAVLFG